MLGSNPLGGDTCSEGERLLGDVYSRPGGGGSGLVVQNPKKGELPKREGWVAHSGAGSGRSGLVYIICVGVFPTFIVARNWQTNHVLRKGRGEKRFYGLGRKNKTVIRYVVQVLSLGDHTSEKTLGG